MKKSVGLGLSLAIVLLLSTTGFAATYTAKTAGGAWNNSNTWNPSGIPGSGDVVNIINSTVTAPVIANWSTITVNIGNGGLLQNTGNLTLQGGNISITTTGTGVFEVTGALSLDQAKINLQGGTVKAGSLSIADYNNGQVNYTSGTLQITGSGAAGFLSIGLSTTFSYPSSIAIPGALTLKNGATLNVSNVGGAIAIDGGSKVNLTTSGTIAPSAFSIAGTNSEFNFAGGTLNATGIDVSVPSGSKITMSSGNLNVRSLTVDGAYAATGGTLGLTTNLTVNSGGTFTSSSAVSVPGNINISSNTATTNVTASNVGGTITVGGSSKLTIANATSTTLTPSNITLNNSGELTYSGGNLTYNNTLNIGGSNKLTVTSGTMTVQALSASGPVNVTGGALTVTNAMTINGAAFTSSAGSTTKAGSLNVTNSTGSSFVNGGTFTVTGTGNATADGPITNNGTMTVGGNLNGGGSGSSVITNNGTLTVSGSVDLPSASKFRTNPGGVTTVNGSVTTRANENLIVGTATNPPPYADFIIKGNLVSSGSGDVLVDKNGRMAVFGNYSSDGGGGTTFKLNDGAQVYVGGTLSFNGGGDHLTNNNDGVPYYGFYSPNQPTYAPSSGSSSNGTAAGRSVQNISTMQSEDPAFFAWVSGLSGSPLPVTLVYFKVTSVTAEGITLSWATASELNFDHFNVQRSSNGKTFETIAEVQGHGTTKEYHEYSFIDKLPMDGTVYYRLQSIDFDGYTETFSVVSATFRSAHDVVLYPVPVTDNKLSFHLNFEPDAEIMVSVISTSGIERASILIPAYETDASMDLSLEPGVYIVKMTSLHFNKTSRIVIR